METAALMLGTDKSRGYCLEMICADFLGGASLENANPNSLLFSISRLFQFLPLPQRKQFLEQLRKASGLVCSRATPGSASTRDPTADFANKCCSATAGAASTAAALLTSRSTTSSRGAGWGATLSKI